MSAAADQLDAAFSAPAPPAVGDSYQSHFTRMQGAANAEQNDAMASAQADPNASPEPPAAPKSLGEKAAAVGKDVGEGIVEAPRAVFRGVHDAYQGVLDLAKEFGDFTNKYLPAIQVTGEGAPRIVSAAERAANPNLPGSLADNINVPDLGIGEPKSTTGTIEKNIVQFITGMNVAGGQLKALGLEGAAGSATVKGILGQFEAFDGAQQNLSNLVQSVPALKNPVSEFLATNPDDNDAVNRLKSAVEGTGIGKLVDGVVQGLRFLRSASKAQDAAEAAAPLEPDAEALAGQVQPKASEGMAALGDRDGDLVRANVMQPNSRVASQDVEGVEPQAAMGAAEVPKEPQVSINFARIDTPDDIKSSMSQIADAFKDNIDSARRGVQTFEDTRLGADSVNAWQTLMSRRVGEPLNAEESLAARQLWATSAAKTQDLSRIATQEPTVENLFAFRKMLATHAAIQEQVIAARTETARALSSWRIPAGTADFRMGEMAKALQNQKGDALEGLSAAYSMAQKVQALAQAGDVTHMGDFIEKSLYAKTRDAALEAWTNGLLTSPLTHVKVAVSNAATVALRIAERSTAAGYSQLLGDTNGVAVGEASALSAGLGSGLKDALRFAGRAAVGLVQDRQLPPLGEDALSGSIKAFKSGTYSQGEKGAAEYSSPGAISSQAFNMSQSGWLGRGVDLLGQLVRVPGRALTAEHDFFRSIGYRMELNAQAVRQATQETQAGKITQDAFGDRVQQIIDNPPPSVSVGAVDGMTYQTFTDAPGKFAEWIGEGRDQFPMMKVILPFYKIPSRILSFTFERSPFAPLMQTYRNNIAAGGSREALARAQMGLGTGVMLAAADAVMSGQITGGGSPQKSQRGAMENLGWQPYSMKVGDRWVQYNRLETAGSSMAMAADIVETLQHYHSAMNSQENPEFEKLAVAAALSVAQDITSKTYLQGISNFFDTIANPKTEGEGKLRSFGGSIVPSGVAAADRLQDPYQRSVYSMLDEIKSRTPGLSESLPPMRNVWGEPVEHGSGLGKTYDALSPFSSKQPTPDSPIDKEILRLGADVNLPSTRTSFDKGSVVDLKNYPQAYSRYVELAGNAWKDPAYGGLGAKDLLNQVVSGNHWLSPIYNMKNDDPGAGTNSKADMIKNIMNQYREGAKAQVLKEYPDIQHEVTERSQQRQSLRMPTL